MMSTTFTFKNRPALIYITTTRIERRFTSNHYYYFFLSQKHKRGAPPELVNDMVASAEGNASRPTSANATQGTATYYDIELHRGSRGFGFSIRGGKDFDGMPLFVLDIAEGGPADMDGRLMVSRYNIGFRCC